MTSQWENDVFDKIKLLIKQSGFSLIEVFQKFDNNNNGMISQKEFKQAMKSCNIGLTDMDIQKIMSRLDANNDDQISYQEFASYLKDDKRLAERMNVRANNKISSLKQQIIQHMVSPTEAFKMVSNSPFYKV